MCQRNWGRFRFTAGRAETLEARLCASNVRHLDGGSALVRYVADQPQVAGSVPADPTLEDLYLYVFRDTAPAARPRERRGAHLKEVRHA